MAKTTTAQEAPVTTQTPEELMQELLAMKAQMKAQLEELEQLRAIVDEEHGNYERKPEPFESKAWSEMRTIFLPRGSAREQNFVLVGVNGRRYQVPRGKSVEVPLPLYERLMIMQEAEEKAYELRKRVQEETDNAALKRVQ